MSSESDEHLVRYLLGELPDDEAEQLDERSITDDQLALRLRMVENELVDRYARGELFDASLERFDRLYRGSPNLREKVRFGQALHTVAAKAEPGRTTEQIRPGPRRFWSQGLAAAAVLVIAVAGYLGVHNTRLREELGQLELRRAAVERQNEQLRQELERNRATPTPPPSPVTATFLLPPSRRGLGNDATTILLRPGTEQVTLRLQVEADDYPMFWVALRDLATTRIVWRSQDVHAEASSSDRIVAVTVPVSALTTQRYSAELSGVSQRGASELVGNYLVRVVLE